MSMNRVDVYFSLGSNLGDRAANLEAAVGLMDMAFGTPYAVKSGLIETAAVGFIGGDFLNSAVMYTLERGTDDAETELRRILATVKKIERQLGREVAPAMFDGDGKRVYRDRTIDIDILFYGTERVATPELTVPHIGIREREFVRIPLEEIAKDSLKSAFPEIFDAELINFASQKNEI